MNKFSALARKAAIRLGLFSAFSDNDTTDGAKIRINHPEDRAPEVGDEVRIIGEDGSATDPAPDGNHIINGGPYDGWVIAVMDGKIEAVTPAEEETEETTEETAELSSKAKIAELNAALADNQRKMAELSASLEQTQKDLATEKANYEALLHKPFANHTRASAEDVISTEGKKLSAYDAAANEILKS